MFRVDPEFKRLIPALSAEEYMQLETNITDDGCRDPLTVWREENLLLDGHNRFEICKRYGMEYELFFVSLPDRQSAINWIINNQLGRRNQNWWRTVLALPPAVEDKNRFVTGCRRWFLKFNSVLQKGTTNVYEQQ